MKRVLEQMQAKNENVCIRIKSSIVRVIDRTACDNELTL